MVDVLCSIVRTTGISDSGAAGRASLHPSTVSRWKRDFPDLAILLRTAREEFRAAQLDLILGTARSGQASGWRAAAWLLERTFPEDYSPRARERAQFQEQYAAAWAAEEEGDDLAPLAGSARPQSPGADGALPSPPRVEALQNVQNSEPLPRPALAAPGESEAVAEPAPASGAEPGPHDETGDPPLCGGTPAGSSPAPAERSSKALLRSALALAPPLQDLFPGSLAHLRMHPHSGNPRF